MLNYTPIVLFSLGLLGILLHILVELNKLNKSSNCTFSMNQYFKLEIFSILISFVFLIVSVIAAQEIKQLVNFGWGLGFSFMAIGYMGQSLLIFVMGKANKIVNQENSTTSVKPDEKPSCEDKQ